MQDDSVDTDLDENSEGLGSAGREQACKRLRQIGWIILALGLLAAVVIYFQARQVPDTATAYEFANGASYPVDVSDTKIYQRNLESVGGKSSLLAAGMSDWFAALWQGTTLSYTVAVIAACLAGLCFAWAYVWSLPPHEDESDLEDWKG